MILQLILSVSLMAANLKLEPLISGLQQPVHVVAHPVEDELLIVEQAGKILRFDGKRKETFLDIRSQVTSGGEMGLLSLAFHPSYKENHRFFINYTARRPRLKTVIAEYRTGRKEEKIILTFDQPYSNHNGGLSLIGPDGYLYIGTGDGGSGGDPHTYAQNKDSFLGKMLRIDVDRGEPYAIPPDNPELGGKKEIFAYGLRNPWRFSFDSKTKALFAADVGQSSREEINLIEKGKNYGWNIMEGTLCFPPPSSCDKTGLTLPIYEYPPQEGNSITGGFVYRGQDIPELYGQYIYGDYITGKIWALHVDQTLKKLLGNELLLNSHLPISSFGEDHRNEILVVSHDGVVYRLVSAKTRT